MLSVIIPANDEEEYIGACLRTVFAQEFTRAAPRRVIVAANGCSDDTAAVATALTPEAERAGWDLAVLDIAQGGKPNALNAGDAAAGDIAPGEARIYLDADVRPDPALFAQLASVLETPAPRYASGQLIVAPAKSWVTRRYGDFWRRLPFMAHGVPGAGLFAVNAAGRARWGAFPDIISDDTFVRLSFSSDERMSVPAAYRWPMVEGFANLRRVRRRQNEGVAEVGRLYPELIRNNDSARLGAAGLVRLILAAPVGFAVYAAVAVAVRAGRSDGWTRGR